MIYVASSWRNPHQPEVVRVLRQIGHEVYDFRNPEPGNNGFHWSEIDENWKAWDPCTYRAALRHPVAIDGFNRDKRALVAAESVVLVLPCGRSAHLEAGYAAGQGKPVFVLMLDACEPELMYGLCGGIYTSISELINAVGRGVRA